jgi:hypothetical protein
MVSSNFQTSIKKSTMRLKGLLESPISAHSDLSLMGMRRITWYIIVEFPGKNLNHL